MGITDLMDCVIDSLLSSDNHPPLSTSPPPIHSFLTPLEPSPNLNLPILYRRSYIQQYKSPKLFEAKSGLDGRLQGKG